MLEKTGKLIAFLFGDPRRNSLEHRVFNTISLLFGVANLGGSLNFIDFEQYPIFLFLAHLVSGGLFLVFYYLSRFQSVYRVLYWPFLLLISAFLTISILRDAGSMGGSHYYMIMAVLVGTILARRIGQVLLAFLMFSLLTAGLFYIEIAHPEMVLAYPGTNEERLMELASQFIFMMIFTAVIVEILVRNLNQERGKSDSLLLNILPESIANELKTNDRVAPLHYDGASVLFTDFVGFTRIAEKLSPQDLITELDNCFRLFDQIMRKHNLEKIKTIGDAYMAVGGIPEANPTHAVDAVLAALQIQRCMDELKQQKQAQGQDFWELRLGIHSGPLVAGVIGEKKFAYDVWGDTVNTASRLESSGEKARVNISGATYHIAQQFFQCEFRGNVHAKNKGDIEMYFVTGILPHLAEADGVTPNERFQSRYWAL
jgi:adenylate cyclase